MHRILIGALVVVAGLAACSEPLSAPDVERAELRVLTRVIDGRTFRLTIDGAVATMSIDGRPATRVRREGERRHVTVWTADGRVVERSFASREALRAAGTALGALGPGGTRFPVPPSAPLPPLGTEPIVKAQGCAGEWFLYGAACAVALAACSAGPTPPCLASIAAAGKALDDLLNCENAT
jgi:hypothetical protein